MLITYFKIINIDLLLTIEMHSCWDVRDVCVAHFALSTKETTLIGTP